MTAGYVVAGAVLVAAGIALFRSLVARPGRAESGWIATDTRASLATLLILILLLFGGGLLLKGVT